MSTDYLLSVADLRGYIPDAAEDDATLQQRIDDTAAELNTRFGTQIIEASTGGDEQVEVLEDVRSWGLSLLPLQQVPAEVLSVADTIGSSTSDMVLDTDYRLRGRHLERIGGARWGQRTVVRYVPASMMAARRRLLIELIRLDMNYAPGMASQGGGAWSEAYQASYRTQREDIMATYGQGEELFA